MANKEKKASIVGIIADVHRHMEGHHYAQWSSVFGLSEEEFTALQEWGIEAKPRRYDSSQDRYQLQCSPWSVMRCLASHFGYVIPVMPIGGLVQSDAGERRTCVFTIQKTSDSA